MPTITLDLRKLHDSGIGTYLRNLVPLVVTAYPSIKFHFLGKAQEIGQYPWTQSENITLADCQSSVYSITEQLELLQKIPKDTTLVWSPHYNIPLFYQGKLLVTVHDVFHLAMPQLIGGLHKQFYAKGMFAALSLKADAILCVSHFTGDELVQLTGQSHQKIHSIHNGVDDDWFHLTKDTNPHHKPFLLFVGLVKPHKNLGRLLQAFQMILDKIPHDLIIVGKKEGLITGDREIAAKASRLGSRVWFTGHVENKVLRQYFAHADALVFPSLYEGFGLPPLEAMACGCPVVVSNAASLPEVCGDAALYFDPYSPEDIARKVQQLLSDDLLREELRLKGRERAKQFTWEKCAKETCKVIERVLS